MLDGIGWDWIGLDGISLNRLTTRSPYGDKKAIEVIFMSDLKIFLICHFHLERAFISSTVRLTVHGFCQT